ncbi:MAG: V-type ATP synthase subunit D [Actinobacteria bacterium]|nr:MAG: V-type ATP synthase subunit D [Actinomycetota bacterium]
MAEIRVNPNRMELLRLRDRLGIARRGHKLLKDKFDELMKAFLALITENRKLRQEIEAELAASYRNLAIARAEAGSLVLDQALSVPVRKARVEMTERTVMNVDVPKIDLVDAGEVGGYGLATVPAVLDEGLLRLSGLLPRLIEMAEREKSIELLAAEIERTRRRVNALEYVLIPNLEDAIRFVTMKLDENERSNRVRLMKIKEIVEAQGELT